MSFIGKLRVADVRPRLKAFWAATFALVIACLILSSRFVGTPFAQFLPQQGNIVPAPLAYHWPHDMHFGDLIVAVDGTPVADRDALLGTYARTRAGQTVHHEVIRQGRHVVVPTAVRQFDWFDWFASGFPSWAFGLTFALLGMVIANKAPKHPEARTFSGLCAAFFVAAVTNTTFDLAPITMLPYFVACSVIGSLLMRLAIQLGPSRHAANWPVVGAALLGVAAYLAYPVQGAAVIGPERALFGFYVWVLAILSWPLLAGGLLFPALIGINLRRLDPMSLASQQNRIILWSSVTAFLPVAIVWSFPIFTGQVNPLLTSLSLFSFILMPVGIVFAVMRYRLFEIEHVIRRTLTYSILAGVLAITYLGAVALFMRMMGTGHSEEFRVALFMALALAFNPMRNWVQARLDQLFDRGRVSIAEMQRLINRRAAEHRDTSQTLEGIARDLKDGLRLDRCALALVQEDQLWTVAGDADLLGICLTVDSLPDVTHWDRAGYPDYAWPDGVEAAVKVILRDQLIGVLLLGEKLSQEPLSSRDFDYLGLVLGQIGVLLSYTQVLDRQSLLDREMQKLLARVSELKDLRASFGIVASHELRTPLTVIKGHAEALLSGAFGQLDEEQRESVNSIFRSAASLTVQVTAYLDLVSLREKRLVMRPSSVDVATVVHEMLEDWHTELVAKDLALRVDVEQAGKVHADSRRLRQLIEQLVSNAVKFTPAGGSICISAQGEMTLMRLQIRDSGPGIPLELIEKAFDDFAQIDDPTERDHGGLGIGLPLAKGLAEAMNGMLTYTPAQDHGAIFTLTLPLAQQPMEFRRGIQLRTQPFGGALGTDGTKRLDLSPEHAQALGMEHVVYEHDGERDGKST